MSATSAASASTFEVQSAVVVPRVAIKFCTQCKWNLRAAYYAQELLQTFSTSLGEVSLQPVSGGIFTITLFHPVTSAPVAVHNDPIPQDTNPANITRRARAPSITIATAIRETLIWDRKRDGGFPETKELKNRIRNYIDPERDLGHIDRSLRKGSVGRLGDELTEARRASVSSASGVSVSTVTVAADVSGEKTPMAEADVELKIEEQAKVADQATATSNAAAGGENLDFGKDLEQKQLQAGKDDCEDCK